MKKLTTVLFALMLPISCIAMLAMIILNPVAAKESAIDACITCAVSVIPVLLPFFILSQIIIKTKISELLGYIFSPLTRVLFNLPPCATIPIIIGFLAGYPTGAKMTLELYKQKSITKQQASRLIGITNNASPMFVISVVGGALSSNPVYGYKLFFIQLFSALFAGIFIAQIDKFRSKRILPTTNNIRIRPLIKEITTNIKNNWNNIIVNSFVDSTHTILQVCSFIIFFGLLASLLRQSLILYFPEIHVLVFTSLIEMTTGVLRLIGFYSVSNELLILTNMIISLGGLSVYLQISSITKEQISLKGYLLYKFVQLSASAIALIYLNMFS